jgi:hypothetical protein
VLDDTTPSDHISKIFLNELGTQSHIILYFHGGLVPRASGLEIATTLAPRFLSINTYPLFFVYETGFLEIVSRNPNIIAGEDVLKALVKRLLKFTVSKLRNPLGTRGLTSVPPTDIELHKELVRRAEGKEPFADESIDRGVSPVSESEQRDLREELKKDKDLTRPFVIGRSRVQVPPSAPLLKLYSPERSFTERSEDIAYTLGPKGLSKGCRVFSSRSI